MAMLSYDDVQLQRLFSTMTVEQRAKALRGAFRREATQVRKVAIGNLRSSGLHVSRGMEKGIKASVFRTGAGFRVSIRGAMHRNRRGLEKPILLFAEGGTVERTTRGRGLFKRRKRHSTGRMPRYAFMTKTLSAVRGTVSDALHEQVERSIIKTAQRYGCI